MKSVIIILCLISSMTYAAQSEVQCNYKFSETAAESAIINPNSTFVTVQFGSTSSTLAHDKAFDVIKYMENQISHYNIQDGLFYSVRRDDKANVMVRGTTGEIVNGRVVNVMTMTWDFGAVDNSVLITGSKALGNLSCRRILK